MVVGVITQSAPRTLPESGTLAGSLGPFGDRQALPNWHERLVISGLRTVFKSDPGTAERIFSHRTLAGSGTLPGSCI